MAAATGVHEVRDALVAARPGTFPVSIGPEEGRALAEWIRREEALTTIEVGLGYGVATLFICEAVMANGPDARHVAIDPYQLESRPEHATRFEGRGLRALEDAGLRDLVEFYAEESQLVLPRLLGAGRRFDFAFVDGTHRFEGVFLDLVYCGRLLRERGVVFVDDAQLPAVRRAVSFCLANLAWSVEDEGAEGSEHEWLVVRTGSAAVSKRPFTEFADF